MLPQGMLQISYRRTSALGKLERPHHEDQCPRACGRSATIQVFTILAFKYVILLRFVTVCGHLVGMADALAFLLGAAFARSNHALM